MGRAAPASATRPGSRAKTERRIGSRMAGKDSRRSTAVIEKATVAPHARTRRCVSEHSTSAMLACWSCPTGAAMNHGHRLDDPERGQRRIRVGGAREHRVDDQRGGPPQQHVEHERRREPGHILLVGLAVRLLQLDVRGGRPHHPEHLEDQAGGEGGRAEPRPAARRQQAEGDHRENARAAPGGDGDRQRPVTGNQPALVRRPHGGQEGDRPQELHGADGFARAPRGRLRPDGQRRRRPRRCRRSGRRSGRTPRPTGRRSA